MMRNLPLLAALLAAPLIAQGTSVQVPAPQVWNQNFYNSYVFFGTTSSRIKNEAHGQALYDVNDISVPGAVFKSLQFRKPVRGTFRPSNVATTIDLVVIMSVSPRTYTTASSTFAANHGTNKTQVFQGKLNLPARSAGGTFPAPWEAPVPFAKPFIYAKALGKSLVIETLCANNSAKRTWYIEGSWPDQGTRTTIYSPFSCRFGNGGANNSISHRNPTIGGSFFVRYNNYPKNVTSFNTNVHVWGLKSSGTWAGFTLPIKFSTLGLPVKNPGCALATDVLATSSLVYNATSGYLTMPGSGVAIPNDPSLLDKCFNTQAISLDSTGAPGIGIHASWASKWCIRSGKTSPARYVYRSGDNSKPTGFGPTTFFVPTFRLNT